MKNKSAITQFLLCTTQRYFAYPRGTPVLEELHVINFAVDSCQGCWKLGMSNIWPTGQMQPMEPRDPSHGSQMDPTACVRQWTKLACRLDPALWALLAAQEVDSVHKLHVAPCTGPTLCTGSGASPDQAMLDGASAQGCLAGHCMQHVPHASPCAILPLLCGLYCLWCAGGQGKVLGPLLIDICF